MYVSKAEMSTCTFDSESLTLSIILKKGENNGKLIYSKEKMSYHGVSKRLDICSPLCFKAGASEGRELLFF
jgi:hypothetical protein